jgi:hypothetical protein
VLQRGRKSRLQRQTLALAANAPAPSHEPSAPFYRLDEPEREIWDEIHREYSFTYGGDLLLCLALQSLGRARVCGEVIAKQGTMIPGRRNVLKPHLLLGIERRSREFCSSVFKKLKIRLRENDCA